MLTNEEYGKRVLEQVKTATGETPIGAKCTACTSTNIGRVVEYATLSDEGVIYTLYQCWCGNTYATLSFRIDYVVRRIRPLSASKKLGFAIEILQRLKREQK